MIFSGEKSGTVVLRMYVDQNLAQLHLNVLREEGIDAYLKDEFMNSVYPFLGYLTGGTKLLVAEEDVSRATEILDSDYSEGLEEIVDDSDLSEVEAIDAEPDRVRAHCPECGSREVHSLAPLRKTMMTLMVVFAIVSSFLLGIAFTFFLACLLWLCSRPFLPNARWACRECHWRGN